MMDYIMLIGFFLISIYLSYRSKVNNCPYRWNNLTEVDLNTLGITLIEKDQKGIYQQYLYRYRKVEVAVFRRKGSLQVIVGEINILKNNEFICHYSDLPLSFKTELFKKYAQIRFSPYCLIPSSKSIKCKTMYQKVISSEQLYHYEGSVK